MKKSGDKHVIVWAGAYSDGSSMWYMRTNIGNLRSRVIRTPNFSEARVFDSFEEAHKYYNTDAVKATYGGKPFIRYYSDKEYFKELLSRE